VARYGSRSPAGADPGASLPVLARRAPRHADKAYRLAAQSRALLELSRRDLLREGLEPALQKIVDTSATVLGVERVGIWLYDRARSHICCDVLHQDPRPAGFDDLDSDRYPAYFAALATHLVIDARNARADPRTSVLDREYLSPLGIHSMLDAPIFVSGRMIGIVCHECLAARRLWTEDEQRFACHVADIAGLLFQEHERRRAEAMTEALLEVARDVSGHLELDEILTAAMKKVAGLLGCDAVGIFRIDEETRETRLVAHFGLTPDLAGVAAELVFTDAQPLAAAVRRGETVFLDHADPQGLISTDLAERFRVRSLVVAPLRTRSRHFGSLVALHQGDRSFDLRQVDFCTAVAAQVAGAMNVAKLYRREREHVAELERANSIKSDFLSAMSHELRTPLHVILGYTEMLLEGAHGAISEEQRDALSRIDAQSRGLFELVSSTLDLGRLEEGRVQVDSRDVDLPRFLAEVAEEARATVVRRRRDLAVTVDLNAAPRRIRTDPGKLRMVLRNLVDNAVKFTESGGIRLACAANDRGGIGIAADLHAEIFESFRQGDAPQTALFGGVGLGLYVVRRLVDLLGGEISLRSRVGQGSRFAVVLPLRDAAAE
jgi:signal transduction histidine kinase